MPQDVLWNNTGIAGLTDVADNGIGQSVADSIWKKYYHLGVEMASTNLTRFYLVQGYQDMWLKNLLPKRILYSASYHMSRTKLKQAIREAQAIDVKF